MLQAIQQLIENTSSRNRPWQVALAISLGLLTGLLPKTGILYLAFAALTFVAPCHLPVALFVAIIASVGSLGLEDHFHSLGMISLQQPQLVDQWLRIDRLPLVPWLQLQKPAVNGALLVGVTCSIPSFVLSYLTLRTLASAISRQRLIAKELSKAAVQRFDEPSSLVRAPKYLTAPTEDSDQLQAMEAPEELVAEIESDRALAELESILEECKQDQAAGNLTGSDEVLARATQLADLVDQILQDYDEAEPASNANLTNSQDDTAERAAISRSPSQGATDSTSSQATSHVRVDQAHSTKPSSPEMNKDSSGMIDSTLQERSPKNQSHTSESLESGHQQLRVDAPEEDVIARQEEALRYLLNHLRGLHADKSKRSAKKEK